MKVVNVSAEEIPKLKNVGLNNSSFGNSEYSSFATKDPNDMDDKILFELVLK